MSFPQYPLVQKALQMQLDFFATEFKRAAPEDIEEAILATHQVLELLDEHLDLPAEEKENALVACVFIFCPIADSSAIGSLFNQKVQNIADEFRNTVWAKEISSDPVLNQIEMAIGATVVRRGIIKIDRNDAELMSDLPGIRREMDARVMRRENRIFKAASPALYALEKEAIAGMYERLDTLSPAQPSAFEIEAEQFAAYPRLMESFNKTMKRFCADGREIGEWHYKIPFQWMKLIDRYVDRPHEEKEELLLACPFDAENPLREHPVLLAVRDIVWLENTLKFAELHPPEIKDIIRQNVLDKKAAWKDPGEGTERLKTLFDEMAQKVLHKIDGFPPKPPAKNPAP